MVWFFGFCFACEQALRGALLRGRENATSLQVEYLHQNRCGMPIDGDDIGIMTSLPFARVFNVCLHSRSFHLRADWRKSDSSDDAEPQGDWNWNSNSRGEEASSPPVLISRLADRAPRRACSQASFSLTELCHEFYQNSVNSNSENFSPH